MATHRALVLEDTVNKAFRKNDRIDVERFVDINKQPVPKMYRAFSMHTEREHVIHEDKIRLLA